MFVSKCLFFTLKHPHQPLTHAAHVLYPEQKAFSEKLRCMVGWIFYIFELLEETDKQTATGRCLLIGFFTDIHLAKFHRQLKKKVKEKTINKKLSFHSM